jgi:hypothetical protein
MSGPNPGLLFFLLGASQFFYHKRYKTKISTLGYPEETIKGFLAKSMVIAGKAVATAAFSFLIYPPTYSILERAGKTLQGLLGWLLSFSAFSNPTLSYCFGNFKNNLTNYPLGTLFSAATAIKTTKLWYDAIKLINESDVAIAAREDKKTDTQKNAANNLREFLKSHSLLVYGTAAISTVAVGSVGLLAQTREYNSVLSIIPAITYMFTSNVKHYLEYGKGDTYLVSGAKLTKWVAGSITTAIAPYLGLE